jgi:tetratricopeptide (TPR) repeat protein
VGDEPGLSATARRTGTATGGAGSIVNTGVMYLAQRPTARSVYLQQVQQIFPFELIGREAELAELAAFCTRPDGGSYVWWQGPAWAGKSALMAWFVLHPPAGVRVASFFVTARFAGQSDRTAFLDVMLEQLADVAGQPLPDALTESNQQAWFNQLIQDAAAACAKHKQRLVLLVDGLDEDRGVTASWDPHSIAALLPARPPAGVRVIVAGRPDPLVPADVPPWHPLRDKKIVRPLPVSPYAQMVRDDAERELDQLLDDRGPGRKLLGLVTAARGGLSRDDLVELSGESPRTVDRTLRSVLGRTFHGRLNRWTSAEPVYLLAHEELQQSAAASLSRDELAGFLGQLHGWADRYRRRDWPAGTPEYLLRGYHRLLVATGDVGRMTELATDLARLDRMLDASGGDAEALAEITAAQEFICGQPRPDLAALLELALTRDQIARRNGTMPTPLPAVWVELGKPTRAEALARSITDPTGQARALAGVAEALATAGDVRRARQVAGEAEATARSVPGSSSQATALAEVAEALARVGDVDRAGATAQSITEPFAQAQALTSVARALGRAGDEDRAGRVLGQAETAARSVADPSRQSWALADIAEALATTGDPHQAEVTARAIVNPSWQARALARVARARATAGDPDRAGQIIREAEATGRSVTDLSWQVHALDEVAEALAAAGDADRARQVLREAEATARAILEPSAQAWTLAGVSRALARTGDLDQAEAAARCITYPGVQADALAGVAREMAQSGDIDRARQVLRHAEVIARSGTDPGWPGRILAAAAEALASAGNAEQAEATAMSITSPSGQAHALARVAGALADNGAADRARQVVREAEATARSAGNPPWQRDTLAIVAEVLAKTGDADEAEVVARSITKPDAQADALAGVARELAQSGDADRTRQVLRHAEATARSVSDLSLQAQALATVAEALAGTGDVNRAEAIARSITEPLPQARALASVAEASARAGDVDRALLTARSSPGSFAQEQALTSVVEALAKAGDVDRAEAIARSIPDSSALASVAEAVAKAGDMDRAEAIARSMAERPGHAQALTAIATVLAGVPGTLTRTGNDSAAPLIARTAAGDRFRRLLASTLAQTNDLLTPLPLLAQVEPAAVAEIAGKISRP